MQGVQQFAVINGQRSLLVCHDIYVEEEGTLTPRLQPLTCVFPETEDPSAALLGGKRQGSSGAQPLPITPSHHYTFSALPPGRLESAY